MDLNGRIYFGIERGRKVIRKEIRKTVKKREKEKRKERQTVEKMRVIPNKREREKEEGEKGERK